MIGARRLELAGRVVLVTGGARGIGLEVARAAQARGALAALVDLDEAGVSAAAGELGGGALGLAADVTDLGALEAATAQVTARLGGIDVLVANAGIGPRASSIEAGDRAHQRRVLDVDMHGVWHTLWAGTGAVVERRGHVVVVSSVAAFVPAPSWAAYGASKAAVEQLARSLRIELAPTGATAGVVHLGLVDTALAREFERDPLTVALERLAPGGRLPRSTAAAAAAAIVDGIERRAPRTIHPAWWRALYVTRGLAGPLADAWMVRRPGMREVMSRVRVRDGALADRNGGGR